MQHARAFSRGSLAAFAFAVLMVVAACGGAADADGHDAAPGQPMRLAPHAQPLTVQSADGVEKARFEVEIADEEAERARGLMFRTDLADDRAMLFVFDDEAPRYFWMQNTPSALDIIYADGTGVIVSIAQETTPFSTMPIPSGEAAKYALEVNAGLTGAMEIGPGDRPIHPVIAGP